MNPFFIVFIGIPALEIFLLIKIGGQIGALSTVALIFLLGGAVGNVFDRFRLGYVVDFIDIRIFPLFNFADIMINIAIFCFLIEMFLYDPNRKSE